MSGTTEPAKANVSYPMKVLYCGECSLPIEYCEYMPQYAKCKQWWERNFPDEFAKLNLGSTPMTYEGGSRGGGGGGGGGGEVGGGETQEGVIEEDEKKRQKRGGKGQIKQKKKTVPQKITIAKIPRAKKKYVTRVCGLATFDIELKEAQKLFAQRFSCGASVTAEDEITIQGDVTDSIMDVIQEKWSEVDDDSIEDLGEVKR
uniref:Density-regulated protein n=1 Tax=Petromyzon marinus TaxID=7757 RepID=A0AAJ7SRK8_PETMA|nr:density-regulated protein [Petromyzon marinus]